MSESPDGIFMQEKVSIAAERFEYFVNLKQWLDGYIMNAERAVHDQQPIDSAMMCAARALRARCAVVILEDGINVAACDLGGNHKWDKPQI